MNVYDIIDAASKIRPGNDFNDEIVETWISQCDASIQIEVCRKKPNTIRAIRAEEWKKNSEYNAGQKVAVKLSGKWHQYIALSNIYCSKTSPHSDIDNWKEIPYDTYVVHPHDRLYTYFIIAMMDYANMEYQNYANDRALYESAVDEFARWWQRNYGYNFVEGVDAYEADVRCT